MFEFKDAAWLRLGDDQETSIDCGRKQDVNSRVKVSDFTDTTSCLVLEISAVEISAFSQI